MEMHLFDFRNAQALISTRGGYWGELKSTIEGIGYGDIVDQQEALAEVGRRPKGGQRAINLLFKERLVGLGWKAEPALFPSDDAELRGWKMDFYKMGVGVEIAFNHAEAIPWIFTRLNLAGESPRVRSDHRVDVGVAMFATEALKAWARMDGAVGTYELAKVWLDEMRPILPIPILVVGLDPGEWATAPTDVFPGTTKSGSLGA